MSAERPSLPEPERAKAPPIRPSERAALSASRELPGERVLCTTVGRAQAAAELARERPGASVCCWFLDDYHRQLATAVYVTAAPNLSLLCAADPPGETVDLAIVPLSMHGEGELTRATRP